MKRIPVFFCTNWNITSWLTVALASLAENTTHKIDLRIIECGITAAEVRIITEFCKQYKNLGTPTFYHVDCEKEFAGCGRWAGDLSAWGRFMFPALAPDLDRAVYLDSDIIVLGDIARLYDMDLENRAVAAAPEIYYTVPHNATRIAAYREMIGATPNHIPFCSGVLVFDLEKWRAEKLTDQLKAVGRDYADKFGCPDQDCMNKLFADNYTVIPNEAVASTFDVNCFQCDYPDRWPALQRDIIVRHFNVSKPWREYYTENRPTAHRDLFWYYAQKTPFADYFMTEFINAMAEKTVAAFPKPQ
ncbi:MAG: hypothetical protein FWC51_02355 [Proteobacteria bacterium]|nr:hypothetical protein [Pseudomonadota bacterium]